MKFGKVENPDIIDFSFPQDHPETRPTLIKTADPNALEVFVGCAKWNRQELKNFYPRGTKDELAYYATQFNAIELNATFYRMFPPEQFAQWYEKTPKGFKFFPKVSQMISHLRRLNDKIYPYIDTYLDAVIQLREKRGTIFLQMHSNFGPKNWDRVVRFVEYWPKEVALAIEFRHADWFADAAVAQELYHLLESNNIANVLVDTAGRRDLLHMRLTNNEAFIRYVGANHPSDYSRLDDWVEKLQEWVAAGLSRIHFFVHQNLEEASPLLSAYLINQLNQKLGTKLFLPKTLGNNVA